MKGGLDTAEPWQGRWAGGILVECVGNQDESSRGTSNRNRQPQTAVQNPGQIQISEDHLHDQEQTKKMKTDEKTTTDEMRQNTKNRTFGHD